MSAPRFERSTDTMYPVIEVQNGQLERVTIQNNRTLITRIVA